MKSKIGKISLVCMAAVMLLACGGGGGGGGGGATPTPTPGPTASPTPTPTPTPAPATHVTINSIDSADCGSAVAYVTVCDEYNDLVTGLTIDDFTLLVNGSIETNIDAFDFINFEDTPVSVSFVMDYSRSAEEILTAMKEGAISFIQGMQNDDEGEIIRFAGNSETTQEFTTVKADLITAINSEFPDATNTDIFTPLVTKAIPDAAAPERTGRGAIILFTDGFHNYLFDDYTADDVITLANDNGIPIFVIGYMFARTDDRIESDRDVLERLAQETGGVYLEAPDTDSFTDLYQQISDLIQNQYKITFNGTGGTSLEIQVDNGGVIGLSEPKEFSCAGPD